MLLQKDIASRLGITTRTLQRWAKNQGRRLTPREAERRVARERRCQTVGRRVRADDRQEQLERLAVVLDAVRSRPANRDNIVAVWQQQVGETPHAGITYRLTAEKLASVESAAAGIPTRWLPYFTGRLIREVVSTIMPLVDAIHRPRRASLHPRAERMRSDEATTAQINFYADRVGMDADQWLDLRMRTGTFLDLHGQTATPAVTKGEVSGRVAPETPTDVTLPEDFTVSPATWNRHMRPESSRPLPLWKFVSDKPRLAYYYTQRTEDSFETFRKWALPSRPQRERKRKDDEPDDATLQEMFSDIRIDAEILPRRASTASRSGRRQFEASI